MARESARQIQSPKVYVRDTGLRHELLGIENQALRTGGSGGGGAAGCAAAVVRGIQWRGVRRGRRWSPCTSRVEGRRRGRWQPAPSSSSASRSVAERRGGYEVHRIRIRDSHSIACWREGHGGYPLLLLHGWPETKRIWSRNVRPLVAAGFEVIAPDLRGFGDSDLAPDGHYDIVAHARDMHALVHDVFGHGQCAIVAGDLGGPVLIDLALRFPGFAGRLCVFNTVTPLLPNEYAAAGIRAEIPREARLAADYFLRQATDADALAAELDTPERRRRYIADFYGHRFWSSPGKFTADDISFMTEPFADADKFRASIANYEYAGGKRRPSEKPRFFEQIGVPTLILYGPADHVVPADFPARAAVAFPEHIGPFVLPASGHFLQWEAADVLNQALRYFFADLR